MAATKKTTKKTTKKKTTRKPRSKTAFAEKDFFEQLKNGGDIGWNDKYIDPKDEATGKDRFYLRFYEAIIASIEMVEKDGDQKTKVTVFGASDKSPVKNDITASRWKELNSQVIDAIQSLYQN